MLTLLDEFFAVRNRYWASFFDKDGKLRKKKLPNLPDARLAIVAALKNPKKHWWVKNGDPNIPPLLAKDYYDLTNQILSVVVLPSGAAAPGSVSPRPRCGATIRDRFAERAFRESASKATATRSQTPALPVIASSDRAACYL